MKLGQVSSQQFDVPLSVHFHHTTPHTYFTDLHLPPTPASPNGRAVCGRSPAEIVGSNPTGARMPVVSVVCCQVEVSATS
jgi:hypothetical protein